MKKLLLVLLLTGCSAKAVPPVEVKKEVPVKSVKKAHKKAIKSVDPKASPSPAPAQKSI